MKTLIYNGRLGEGVCAPRSGKAFGFKRGASIEVSEKVADELLETGEWAEAAMGKHGKKDKIFEDKTSDE